LTDNGNARRVVERHGADLHYCHPKRSWLIWDGRRWKEDATGEAERRVKRTRDGLYSWASRKIQKLGEVGDGDDSDRKEALARYIKILKHCLSWEGAKQVSATLQLARSEPGIPVLPEDLDRDPWSLNCLNGTLDLHTGQLRPHRREDLLTRLAPVEYEADATCPLWLRFLDRIMDGNQDVIEYLQRVIGYALTGDVSEQCLYFLYGGGSNGKSTFLGTIQAMLGDYAIQAVSELLMAKHNESHPTERADLFGRRFVATIETEEGKRVAESLMKQLTGGDKIKARWMHKDFFEFKPQHKIFLAANHKPVIRGRDHAIWRRIKLVPFTVTITDDEKDKALPDKLQGELPGILAWAVRGCLDWQQRGMGEPEEVTKATHEYEAEQDDLAGFMSACCFANREYRCRVSAFLELYHAWSGDKQMSQKEMSRRMRDKGYESARGHGGAYYYLGIDLKPVQPDSQQTDEAKYR
jgi:putative DNA primase/helicase